MILNSFTAQTQNGTFIWWKKINLLERGICWDPNQHEWTWHPSDNLAVTHEVCLSSHQLVFQAKPGKQVICLNSAKQSDMHHPFYESMH